MGHVNSLLHLKIKSITLNGHHIKSLFATKQFKAGEFIMPYIAEVITQATYDNRYSRDEGGAYYVFHDANNIIYDSSSIRGVASWANRTSAFSNANATLKSYRNAYPNVIAIKDINIDDEISIHAGDGRFDVVDQNARIDMFDTECEQCPQEYEIGEF
jgi:SET domain-containing protein